MKIYRYIYYKCYCLWLKKKDEPENAYINAILSITFLVYLTLIDISYIPFAFFERDIFHLPPASLNVKIVILTTAIALGIFNYFLLAYKKKYLKIVEEFKDETEKQRKRGTLYVWIYAIVTIGIPLFILFFIHL